MRQRVALAHWLVVDPDIILLDESFSQLDAVTSMMLRAKFLSLVKQLKKTCVSIIHRIDDALDIRFGSSSLRRRLESDANASV